MKTFSLSSLLIIFLFTSGLGFSQKTMIVKQATYFDKTKPLRDMPFFAPEKRDRSWKEGIIRNETPEQMRSDNPSPLPLGPDALWQKSFGAQRSRVPFANFEGVGNANSVYPPDTDGDVGPDHYFQMINLSFAIYDKQGNILYGPADNRTLWNGFVGPWTSTNDGDPILLYDEMADRWVATQFAINTPDGTYWELIAVSATGDPLGEWYRYAFQYPVFNDYPKMGVWPDGYYFSFNMFGADYRRVAVSAHERGKMLAGDSTARMVLFDLPQGSLPWSMLPSDFDGPPPPDGAPNYFIYGMDDAYYPTVDQLSLWEFKVDWDNPFNSTFEEVTALPVEPFDTDLCDAQRERCIHQPDNSPRLECLSDRLMFRLQYRNFGSYQAMVTNHTVDVDGTGHAGIRWYELRNNNDGGGWYLYQQGTYAPDADHRWMGSIAMDGRGYIALGFSVSSETTYPSIRYTGRSPDATLGQMTFYEEEIMAGSGSQTGDASRWGDYSMMSVDPATDTTFWYTTEYVKNTGTVTWRTRIAGFTLMEDLVAPFGVLDLSATAATTNAVHLAWTATGDDGATGTAFLYDIRYSTEPITEENFSSALQVPKTPKPKEAGTPEIFTAGDLAFSTHYYFAMKVRDRQFNFSPMSNVVEATTPAAPEIGTPEDAVVQKLFPGSVGTRSWQLRNDGGSDIYYRIIKDTLSESGRPRNLGWYADTQRTLDPAVEQALQEAFTLTPGEPKGGGDVLGTYLNATYAVSGMAWVGGLLYMCDMQGAKLVVYDTASQAIVQSYPIHSFPYGMAWDEEFLWIGDKFGNVYAYNTDGSAAGYSFSCPVAGNNALAWDGTFFLANFILENDPKVYRLDETGGIVEKYQAELGNRTVWQSVWAPEHYTGNLWITNNNGLIIQLRLEEGRFLPVKEFDAPFNVSYALTHDHIDLWYGKVGGTVFRVDDGMDEVQWLTVTPDKATIPGPSVAELSLTFDAGVFEPGKYHANMVISSNDPDEPVLRVPVDLVVSGPPDIGPDTSFCGHLYVTLDAGEGFAGYHWSDGGVTRIHTVDSSLLETGTTVLWVDVTDLGGTVQRDSISVTLTDCSSIFEFSSGLTVTIYPNPSRGMFTVEAAGAVENIMLNLTDLAGRPVLHREMSSPGKLAIDLDGNTKGQYLLRVTTEDGLRVQRIIVY